MYVVYVWTGGWLISLVLVTSDNKGLLLLLLLLKGVAHRMRSAAPRLEQLEVSHTRRAHAILINDLKCVETVVSW